MNVEKTTKKTKKNSGLDLFKIKNLIHFQPMFHFYSPWKYQKTFGFLIFSGCIEVEQWLKIG